MPIHVETDLLIDILVSLPWLNAKSVWEEVYQPNTAPQLGADYAIIQRGEMISAGP